MTLEEYALQEGVRIIILDEEEILIPSLRWDEVKDQFEV